VDTVTEATAAAATITTTGVMENNVCRKTTTAIIK